MFGKADAARLGKAVDIAKKAGNIVTGKIGVDSQLIVDNEWETLKVRFIRSEALSDDFLDALASGSSAALGSTGSASG